MNTIADPLNIERATIDGAVYLPLALLKPSPTNPRKRFDPTHLQELADSVRKHGVIQPILARAIAGAKAGEPLYEIVAGERRWRASQIAEQPTIMALLREMTDFEVLELQVIENLQRDDLHPIEEAEGFRALLRTADGLQGYATADELATRIGKSRRHVFNRLKLLDLIPEARDACLEGKLTPTVALLVAAMPQHVQPEALKGILAGWGGEPYSLRQAAQYLQSQYMLVLSGAPFKITDAELVPTAGSCRECPKRTGANPDLFDDVKNDDTCTDAKCFNLKVDTHRRNVMDTAREQGLEVITGQQAKKLVKNSYDQPTGYLALDKVHYSIADKPLAKLLGKDAPQKVLIENPHTHEVMEVVPEAAAMKVLQAKGIVKQAKVPKTNADERKRKAQAAAASAFRQNAARQIIDRVLADDLDKAAFASLMWPEVAIVMWSRLSNDDERRCEKLLGWDHIGSAWSDRNAEQKLEDRIRALTSAEIGRLITLMCLASELHVSENTNKPGHAPRIERFAQALNVDLAQIRRDLAAGFSEPRAKAPKKADATDAFVAAHSNAGARSGSAATRKAVAAGKPAVRYRDPMTGSTWSGRGLKPRWLVVALDDGHTLEEFDVQAKSVAAQEAADPQVRSAKTLKAERAAPLKVNGGAINPAALQGQA